VWDVLERRERLAVLKPKSHGVYLDGRIAPPLPEKLEREERELNRLSRELREKGTPRDRLILELGSYGRLRTWGLSQRDEFQQFRSEVEQMSDEEITAEIHRRNQFAGPAFYSGVSIFDVLKRKEKKP
jgi:hypothetical protein